MQSTAPLPNIGCPHDFCALSGRCLLQDYAIDNQRRYDGGQPVTNELDATFSQLSGCPHSMELAEQYRELLQKSKEAR